MKIPVTFAIFASLICGSFFWIIAPTETRTRAIEVKGSASEDLRREIVASYELTKKDPRKIADEKITLVIKKYIPKGTSFERAENLLRETGFTIDMDPFNYPKRTGERHDSTVAILRGFIKSWVPLPSVNLVVRLTPKERDDFDFVFGVEAKFDPILP